MSPPAWPWFLLAEDERVDHMRTWKFAKGHGTLNDFVLLIDRHGMLDPNDDDVRFICDRHAGIGADGLLRAIQARHIDEWDGDPELWFMDYRNADGSIAEMCGNGVRVFARYLLDQGLASGPALLIATRAGLKEAIALPNGGFRVSMGPALVGAGGVEVIVGSDVYPALPVDVGNPHAVSFVEDLSLLDFGGGPRWLPEDRFPAGVNCEFVARVGDGHIKMRVYERGAGETLSCGTGTVAAAAASAVYFADQTPAGSAWQVDVPGGSLEVELDAGQSWLSGPAVIVGHGEIMMPDG